jgi:hypothetical protein
MACNFQTGNNKIKLLTEYESVSQKVLFDNAALASVMSVRKYDVILHNCDFGFSKQSPLSKCNFVTELNMEKIHLQILLSDVG